MATFNSVVLTDDGRALLARAQAGTASINFTRAASGNGSYGDSDDPSTQTALKNEKQTFDFDALSVQNSTNVYLKFTITNYKSASDYLTEGYYVTEVGIFAEDPDDSSSEILYAIATAVEDEWDYLPSYNSVLPSTITIEMLVEVNNSSSVTLTLADPLTIYDDSDGTGYVLGINNGLLYYEEVE